MRLNHTKKELDKIGRELRGNFRRSLAAQGKRGNLSRSIEYEVNDSPDGPDLQFLMNDYADFVDQGVQGSKRNIFPGQSKSPYKFGRKTGPKGGLRRGIDRWVVRKNIKGTRDDKGRFAPRKSTVFLISRAVYERGLKPSYFITRPLERMQRKIDRRIANAYEKDVQEYLDSLE